MKTRLAWGTTACAAAVGCALSAAAFAAQAETLADAIAQAYRTNPGLQQQRAELRGLDENHVEAAAGLRPTVTAQVIGQYNDVRLGRSDLASARLNAEIQGGPAPATRNENNTLNSQIVITQPVFTGGRVSSAIRQADGQILAGREALRATEGDLLLNVIDAYTSVRRDQAIVGVRRTSVGELQHQLDEAAARRGAGDATITDVEQARAQLESERANYASAGQQLQASRNSYTTLVGTNPGELAPEPVLPGLPPTIDQAFDRAEAASPELREAILTETASRAAVQAARAAQRPSLSLQGTYGYNGAATPLYERNLERSFTAEAVLTQPLFTGGQNASNIRRALAQNSADRLAIEATRRQVVQTLSNAWNTMLTARANVATQERSAAAARATFVGMQEEYRAGQRSTFEVLYAEQTLHAAEILLLQARHDLYVGAAAVLRYSGGLEARTLLTDAPLYDPSVNTRRVARIGAFPADPLLRALDGLAAPAPGLSPVTAPAPARGPQVAPASIDVIATAPAVLDTALPTAPLPGTAVDGLLPGGRSAYAPAQRPRITNAAPPSVASEPDPIAALIALALAGHAP